MNVLEAIAILVWMAKILGPVMRRKNGGYCSQGPPPPSLREAACLPAEVRSGTQV